MYYPDFLRLTPSYQTYSGSAFFLPLEQPVARANTATVTTE